MIQIRHVTRDDRAFWLTLDKHLAESEFQRKVRDRRGYLICDEERPVGVMRYNLFWDTIPFLTLLYVEEPSRGRGFGRQAMLFWENEMKNLGCSMVMTSTQADEDAQHFYRKLGYLDRGALFLDNTPFKQPQEIILLKTLG